MTTPIMMATFLASFKEGKFDGDAFDDSWFWLDSFWLTVLLFSDSNSIQTSTGAGEVGGGIGVSSGVTGWYRGFITENIGTVHSVATDRVMHC